MNPIKNPCIKCLSPRFHHFLNQRGRKCSQVCQFLDTQAIYDWLRPSSCSHPYWTSFLYFNAASSAMPPSSAGAGGSENFQTGSTRAQPRLTSVLMATHLFLPFTTSKSYTRRFSRQISSSYPESNISKILRKRKSSNCNIPK